MVTGLAIQKNKYQLLQFVRKVSSSGKYKIQKLAHAFSSNGFEMKILFLPVNHPELNPIEMVWSYIERNAASRNLRFTLSCVEKVVKETYGRLNISKYS